jgi:hypothetical protein
VSAQVAATPDRPNDGCSCCLKMSSAAGPAGNLTAVIPLHPPTTGKRLASRTRGNNASRTRIAPRGRPKVGPKRNGCRQEAECAMPGQTVDGSSLEGFFRVAGGSGPPNVILSFTTEPANLRDVPRHSIVRLPEKKSCVRRRPLRRSVPTREAVARPPSRSPTSPANCICRAIRPQCRTWLGPNC